MFLISPLKIVNALKNPALIDEATKKPDKWYFSREGKEEYDKANTLLKKTEYFYNYLLSLSYHRFQNINYEVSYKDTMYKLAYVIAHSVDGSSLPFAKYPDILDSEKNPLVYYAEYEISSGLEDAEKSALNEIYMVSELLEEVYNKLKKGKRDKLLRPYKDLEMPNPDGTVSDLYKLERDIIWIFRFEEDTFPYDFTNGKIHEMLSDEKENKKLRKILEEENSNV